MNLMDDNELTPKQAEALDAAMRRKSIIIKCRQLPSRLKMMCECGGTFEIVEVNPPHLQCAVCDGTKCIH
jgi:hypothetical protein